ncbi:MAG: hypothetical protein E7020_04105 [Alphaproteobacteria bacterium]|nr:hypothetical protein [Alphaproteobacteria bacterium]
MKNLAILFLSLLFASEVYAQKINLDALPKAKKVDIKDVEIEPEEEVNAFGFPYKSFVVEIDNKNREHITDTKVNIKPACNDAKLAEQVRSTLEPYISNNRASINERRKIELTLRNIADFEDVKLDNVNGNNNPLIAAKIIELKVNGGIESKNIKVCYNSNPVSENQLYLLMYDAGDQIIVEILNFLEKEAPRFIFRPQ